MLKTCISMSDFTPLIPLELQIRKIIFEKFNDIDTKFTNDDIFEILKSEGDINPSWIIDDTESLFNDLCDSGLVRNIAQNFTTIFLKLFDTLFILTRGGPGNDTTTLGLWTYKTGFIFLEMSRAAALGVIILIITMPVYLLWRKSAKSVR